MAGTIVIKGARVHNLKNIDLDIPRGRFVVITGVSGSGKSSLAFDTLYAEGQRRYLESLGSETRQLLQHFEQPDVDSIEGLSPTVAVQQKPGLAGPRSTVGTLTDSQDYLRLLFARIGQPHCVQCGRAIRAHTVEQIVDQLLSLPAQTRLILLAPVPLSSPADWRARLGEFARQGFTRVMIDGEMRELGGDDELAHEAIRELDLVIDRLALRDGVARRLADSLEVAARHGGNIIKIQIMSDAAVESKQERLFSLNFVCAHCGTAMPEITPSLFSFNSPHGACPSCDGLGVIAARQKRRKPSGEDGEITCPECRGSRLSKESRAVRIAGRDIAEIAALPMSQGLEFFATLQIEEEQKLVAQKIVDQIVRRFQVMADLGLEYLSLDRRTITLSGGELQRVRLATQIGAAMAGVLYVLDEPSIGLHQRDNAKLLALIQRLRDAGNTVLVVEHDRETMLAADYLIDMGPAAGVHGGEVVAQGPAAEISRAARSLTGGYLSGALKIPIHAPRRIDATKVLTIRNASAHNLKNLTVAIPIGAITCVTGLSGAGKSTLVMDVLFRGVAARLQRRNNEILAEAEILGWENLARVIGVDQTPIGRTPRSNPATYTGLYDPLRGLFAQLPEARVRGYGSERFSFNASGGRCEACAGEGVTRVEMYFLPPVFVTCSVCKGRRYNRETLDIQYKGLSIADILDLTVDQALELLASIPPIHDRLRTLRDVGLGYLRLGQPASTLAGGEAQRIKLARELARRSSGRSLYVLDEPTAGLHFEDVRVLLDLLHRLADSGHTIVIVEHNLDVIKNADHVIDLGPEGGDRGGEIIALGRPEDIAQVTVSATGRYLRKLFERA